MLVFSDRGKRKQAGQIVPVALFGLLVLSTMLAVMYNTGQKVTDKSQVANAADAASYSGAVWTARHLNFMAYTNRAMIANHVAVGHYISYISWFRYVADSIEQISDYTSWIPYWGEIIEIINDIVSEVNSLNDDIAEGLVPAVDSLNTVYRAAQAETRASLVAGCLNDLMEKTAKTYDPTISVNSNGDLSALPSVLRVFLQAEVTYQVVQLPMFVKRYSAEDDDDRIKKLITQSYQAESDTRNWISGNRGWSLDMPEVPVMHRLKKYGSTSMEQDDESADWKASDELQFCHKVIKLFKTKWKCVAIVDDDAKASEFDDDYSGVPNYYNLDADPGDNPTLDIAAVASKKQAAVATKDLFGVTNNDQPMLVASMARVEFKRPSGFGFPSVGTNKEEYANLFNPFWDAHLVAFDIPGFGS